VVAWGREAVPNPIEHVCAQYKANLRRSAIQRVWLGSAPLRSTAVVPPGEEPNPVPELLAYPCNISADQQVQARHAGVLDVAQLCYNAFFTIELAMSTTTIRLPQDLKERIARAAARAGTTAHSFILEAIAEKAEQEERRGEFQNTAERRYAKIVASGKTVPWNEMRRYLERRLTNKKVARPKPRTLAR